MQTQAGQPSLYLHPNTSEQLWNTTFSCPPHQKKYPLVLTIFSLLNDAISIPTCLVIMKELAARHWASPPSKTSTTSSSSPSSSDIFLCNIIVIALVSCLGFLCFALRSLQPPLIPIQALTASMTVILIAGPLSVMALSLDCYLAVVHPVRYMGLKRSWKFPAALIAFIWLVTGAMVSYVLATRQATDNAASLTTIYLLLPPYIFLNVSTLQGLRLAGPKRQKLAHLSPVKRRAFWIVLGILGGTVLYSFPVVGTFTYRRLTGVDDRTFFCVLFPLTMIVPTMSGCFLVLFVLCSVKPAKCCTVMH